MAKSSLYRAVWRWHFYAGLLTLPFLLLLATTGGIYLFKDEIDARLYRRLVHVEPQGSAGPTAAALVARASEQIAGQVTGYLPPAASDRAARVFIDVGGGRSRDVFVDPYTGTVLGDLPRAAYNNLPLMSLIRQLHSLESLGWVGNRLVEIVAGWVLILVMTGVYLWWPRQQSGGVVTVRRDAGRRTFWRDLHAVTGIFAAAFITFLAATGLPWSGFWGEHLKNTMNQAGLGYPTGFWFPVEESTIPFSELDSPAPWTIANAPVPSSRAATSAPLSLDDAIAIFEAAGMPRGYTVSLPLGSTGVYSASVIPDQVAGTRAMHIDQYSGAVLFDVGFAELGPAARAIEFGSSVHTGQEYGRINQLAMLLTCIGVVLMTVTSAVMWWQRRPKGSLGAPRYPADYRVPRAIFAIAACVGIVLPLVGLSMVAMLAVDLLLPNALRVRLA